MKKIILCLLVLSVITVAKAASYEQLYKQLSQSPGLSTKILPLSEFTVKEMIDKAVMAEKRREMFGITQTRASSPGIKFYLVSISANFKLAHPQFTLRIGYSSQVLSQYAGGELLDFSFQPNRTEEYTKDFICAETTDHGKVIRICGEGQTPFNESEFNPDQSNGP